MALENRISKISVNYNFDRDFVASMRVEYDRMACAGWFQCTQEWDAFEMNPVAGKADFQGGETTEDDVVVRSVPEELEDAAKAAAESCPVDAIKIFDEDGEQLVP